MEMLGSFDFFRRAIRVHAQFNTVQELKEGDPVKMAGVQIGRVEKIRLADNKVDVTMKLDRSKASVKTDCKAVIKFAGLMGQNFVSIGFGSPSALKMENDTILETEEQPDLNAMMAKIERVATGVENLTKSFSGDSIQNLLGPFSDFIKENNPRLTAFLANMKTISTQIVESKGSVGKFINEDTFYTSVMGAVTNFQQTASDIQAGVTQARNVIAEINEGKGTLGKLAKDDAFYKEATAAMTNLKEIFQKINQGQGSAGKLVNDDSLYKNAKLSLQSSTIPPPTERSRSPRPSRPPRPTRSG